MNAVTIVVADDHAIVRAGIRAVLAAEPDLRIVAEASDGRAAVDAVVRHRPHVLMIDLTMPGLNGLEAIGRVRALVPSTRILVLSMHGAADFVLPALRAGALGYLVKGAGLDHLVPAIRAVARGEAFFDPTAERVAHLSAPGRQAADALANLTPREREVLQLVAEGHTNREIADRLGLSPKTVDTHRTSAMRKLGVHDVQGLTRFAVRCGLVAEE